MHEGTRCKLWYVCLSCGLDVKSHFRDNTLTIFEVAFVYLFLQARHDINNDDIPAARRHWHTACQWPYLGACIWISVLLPIVISGLIIGVVLAIVL